MEKKIRSISTRRDQQKHYLKKLQKDLNPSVVINHDPDLIRQSVNHGHVIFLPTSDLLTPIDFIRPVTLTKVMRGSSDEELDNHYRWFKKIMYDLTLLPLPIIAPYREDENDYPYYGDGVFLIEEAIIISKYLKEIYSKNSRLRRTNPLLCDLWNEITETRNIIFEEAYKNVRNPELRRQLCTPRGDIFNQPHTFGRNKINR